MFKRSNEKSQVKNLSKRDQPADLQIEQGNEKSHGANVRRETAIKEKFQTKLEIEKRKQDFLEAIGKIKKSRSEVLKKNKEIKELIRQEEILQKEKLKRAQINYRNSLANQRKEIAEQKSFIRAETLKNKETARLENAKVRQQILNKRLSLRKEIAQAKKNRKKLLLENKEQIQRIKRDSALAVVKNKKASVQKKLELSKQKIAHLEKVAEQKKELENLKRQYVITKSNSFRVLENARRKIIKEQKTRKQEIAKLIQNEKNALELDIIEIKKKKISYKTLLKEKEEREKLRLEQLKFETERIKQQEQAKTIIEKDRFLEKGLESHELSSKSQSLGAFANFDYKNKSVAIDEAPPLPIDLSNDTIKGIVISEVGKKALRVFERLNASDRSYPLERAKISIQERELIEKVRKLKSNNELVPISDYAQLAAFIKDEKLSSERVQAIIVSIIYNLIKGKTLSFLGGYFSIVKVHGYRKIVYSQSTRKKSRFSIVSLPETEVTKKLEEIILRKLAFQPFIKITENIVLANINNNIKVITDMAFMR